MSRTYRIKNNHEETNSGSSRVAGAYTEFDTIIEDSFDVTVIEVDYWTGCEVARTYKRVFRRRVARMPTKKEAFKTFKFLHGESSSGNSRSPGKWFRNNRMRENRQINRSEISKFMKNTDYELMCEEDPRDCHWDWS